MKLIDNKNITQPQINLSLEEYALHQIDLSEDHLLFYINEPSVIIGRHQNTHEQINHHYIEKNNVHVVRRVSGGGAVYHDLGNLNYSFMTKADNQTFNVYETFTKPIIQVLHQLGINAELSGRNDILVNGKKISGNAQYRSGDRMFCHGTLLFNTNLDHVVEALNVNPDKIQSKGIQSIRSRVANISEFLSKPLTIDAFKQAIINQVFADFSAASLHEFSETDWQNIHQQAKNKYQDWNWNYGKSPECNIQNRKRFSIGEVDIRLLIKNDRIENAKIFGDFFAKNDISELEKNLIDVRYEKQSLQDLLTTIDLNNYFCDLDSSAFLDLIFTS